MLYASHKERSAPSSISGNCPSMTQIGYHSFLKAEIGSFQTCVDDRERELSNNSRFLRSKIPYIKRNNYTRRASGSPMYINIYVEPLFLGRNCGTFNI